MVSLAVLFLSIIISQGHAVRSSWRIVKGVGLVTSDKRGSGGKREDEGLSQSRPDLVLLSFGWSSTKGQTGREEEEEGGKFGWVSVDSGGGCLERV
jgi:hypothetical protein